MSGSNSSISQTSYKQDLVNYLSSKANFSGFNFKGTNIDMLLDILDYNTQRNAAYQNMTFAEAFLDSAQLYSNITSRAKELGYIARSATASQAILNLTFNVTDNISSFVVPAGFTVSAKTSNNNYNFQTLNDIIVSNNNGNFTANNVTVVEGFPVTESFVYNTDQNIYTLSNPSIDTSTLKVTIQNSNTSNIQFNYLPINSLVNVNCTSNVYWVETSFNNNYGVVFGDGVFGNQLSNGNIINCTYFVTSQDIPNGLTNFVPQSFVGNNYTCSVNVIQPSAGGGVAETAQSIKFNAPRYFRSQDRAITADDYKVLLLQQFPQIVDCNVYGGETLPGTTFTGNIYISVQLSTGYVLSTTLINQITNFIKTKNITPLAINILNVNQIFINCSVAIYYSPTQTTKSQQMLSNTITQSIQNFSNTNLNAFQKNYWNSTLENVITNLDQSFDTASIKIILDYPISINFNTSQYITINYGNAIAHHSINDYNFPNIYSSNFYISGALSTINDDGNGNLNIYSFTSNNNQVLNTSNIGTVDYKTGLVEFSTPNIQGLVNDTKLHIYAKPQNDNIISSFNNVLVANANDVQFNIVN